MHEHVHTHGTLFLNYAGVGYTHHVPLPLSTVPRRTIYQSFGVCSLTDVTSAQSRESYQIQEISLDVFLANLPSTVQVVTVQCPL